MACFIERKVILLFTLLLLIDVFTSINFFLATLFVSPFFKHNFAFGHIFSTEDLDVLIY